VLEVGVRIARVGTKSLDMEHEIRTADDRLVAEASAVLVAFDYERNVSIQVPDDVREKLQAYEARSQAPA
jgi:acyl-CoA thioester hydrolase